MYTKKNPIRENFFCQPFSTLLRPSLLRLLQFGPSMFNYQATNLLGPKYSPASVASYTPVLAAQRRIAKAYIVPFSLLAALRPSLPILEVPLKNYPNFWSKMGVLGSIYRPKWQYSTVSTVFVVVVRYILSRFLSVRCSIRIVGRFLSVAVRCQRRFRRRISTELIGSCSSTM